MTQPSYKRGAEDRDLTFHRPYHGCYACNDTGIVANSDGMVNEFLPDYDRLPDGRRVCGSDLALICHCPAAFPSYDGERQERAGLRESSGAIRKVDGNLPIGAEIPKATTQAIHLRRLANWRLTEKAMSEARAARAAGQADARPWFLVELRSAMEEQAKRVLREAQATGNGGLQSLGSCLAEVVGGEGGILQAAGLSLVETGENGKAAGAPNGDSSTHGAPNGAAQADPALMARSI